MQEARVVRTARVGDCLRLCFLTNGLGLGEVSFVDSNGLSVDLPEGTRIDFKNGKGCYILTSVNIHFSSGNYEGNIQQFIYQGYCLQPKYIQETDNFNLASDLDGQEFTVISIPGEQLSISEFKDINTFQGGNDDGFIKNNQSLGLINLFGIFIVGIFVTMCLKFYLRFKKQ